MMEVLQFVFSDFWVWLGTVVLVATLGQSIAAVLERVK
jgi:hypothetical protein